MASRSRDHGIAVERKLEWVPNDHPNAIPTNSVPNKPWFNNLSGAILFILLLAIAIVFGLVVAEIIPKPEFISSLF